MRIEINKDGYYSQAEPLGPQGAVAKVEFYLRSKGLKTIPNLLAKWDERNLG